MTEIKYDNTTPEIRRAYALFRKKYALPRMVPLSLAFAIAIVFGIDFIIRSPSDFVGYILTALGAGMLFSLWWRPYLTQKKLISTIETLNDEKYTARFLADSIEIETEIIQKDEKTETVAISSLGVVPVENPEAKADAETKITLPETTKITLATEELFSVEAPEMFCIFVNRALIYIFPKRCLSEEQTEAVRAYFKDKSI